MNAQSPVQVRRFRIVDAMVLVASLAIGFALIERQVRFDFLDLQWSKPKLSAFASPKQGDLVTVIASLLTPLTLAVLVLRLLPTRPRRRRLFEQPGFTACAMVIFMDIPLIFGHYQYNINFYQTFFPDVSGWNYLIQLNYRPEIAYAVAASWTLLALSGRWRAERSWVDRAGRVVGWLWILLIPMRWFSPF
jgi:hypothetical protein